MGSRGSGLFKLVQTAMENDGKLLILLRNGLFYASGGRAFRRKLTAPTNTKAILEGTLFVANLLVRYVVLAFAARFLVTRQLQRIYFVRCS